MESSKFDNLPPELRNAIYKATFQSRYAVKLASNAISHPLTGTCRKARREAQEMYLSMTRFNAHLGDGPAAPLARWLRVLGRRRCLLLREVNIWNMHDLINTLHGTLATQQMLVDGPPANGGDGSSSSSSSNSGDPLSAHSSYILRPISRELLPCSRWLSDIALALHSIGLGLSRFCVARSGVQTGETSHFAILPLSESDFESGLDAPGFVAVRPDGRPD